MNAKRKSPPRPGATQPEPVEQPARPIVVVAPPPLRFGLWTETGEIVTCALMLGALVLGLAVGLEIAG